MILHDLIIVLDFGNDSSYTTKMFLAIPELEPHDLMHSNSNMLVPAAVCEGTTSIS